MYASMKSFFSPSQSEAAGRFSQLPGSVLRQILFYCDKPSLNAMASTCSYLYEVISPLELSDLPAELLLIILTFLDRQSLGRVAQVNSRFMALAYADCMWLKASRGAIATCTDMELSARDKVRISENWERGRYVETMLLAQNERYMPRVQLDGDTLWASWGARIWAHRRDPADGTISRETTRVLTAHRDDVSTFIVKDGLLVSGGRDQSLVAWQSDSGHFLFAKRYCHKAEISGVDVVTRGNRQLIVSGSTDGSVKFWAAAADGGRQSAWLAATSSVKDRIYALAAGGATVVVGSAGLSAGTPSLHAVDVATGAATGLGAGELRRGAGTLDLAWVSEERTFLSCGHDTRARLWDLRCPAGPGAGAWCVRAWEEPFDDAVYCMATDRETSLVCGMARHGLVRLWDLRQAARPVAFLHSTHSRPWQSSPVYSIAADASHVYVALDQCLNLVSFAGNATAATTTSEANNNNQKQYIYGR